MSFQEKLRKLFEKDDSERVARQKQESLRQQEIQEEAKRREGMILELKKILSQEIVPILEMVNSVYLKRKGVLKVNIDARAKDLENFKDLSQGICSLIWDVKEISYSYRSGHHLAIVVKFDGSGHVEAGYTRIEASRFSLKDPDWRANMENSIIDALSTGKTKYEHVEKEEFMSSI